MDEAVPLLVTKLRAPRLRPDVVVRDRLHHRLTRDDLPALTLVSAPAGFGKTTLVAERLVGTAAEGGVTAWLSLDPRDSDPAVFWPYVVAALDAASPGVGASAAALLGSPSPSIDAAVATLLNALDDVAGDVVLVLDDYHVVTSPDVHETVVYLVEHLPPHVHVVVTTRADPPWPLAGLRARGALREVRAADLRFSPGEVRTYLASMGLALADEDATALGERTEGWIAALQLAALSLQGRDDPSRFVAEFTGDDRFVLDYLAGEVLDRQVPAVRDFLLRTAVLRRLSGPLCDAVTGGQDGRTTLEALERANLFVVPLDDRRAWYRYHHLFADVLRARLLDERPEVLPSLHRRASDWHEQHGERDEAIRHALDCDDPIRAAELIEPAIPALRRARQEATMRSWLEALPPDVLRRRPVLCVGLVGARMASGEIADAEDLLSTAERQVDPARTGAEVGAVDDDALRRLPTQIAMYRAAIALVGGDLAGTLAQARLAHELATDDDHLAHGAASALLGLALWAQGDLEEAEGHYRDAIARFDPAGHHSDILGCSLALADIQVARGHLDEAERTLRSALARDDRHGPLRGRPDVHVGMSELRRARGDAVGAEEHLQHGAERGEAMALGQYPYRSRVAAALLRQGGGDLAGALDLLAEAEELYDTDLSPPVQPVPAATARLHLVRGDVTAALGWVNASGVDPGDELTYVREYEHVTLARILLAHHAMTGSEADLATAIGLLDRILAAAEEGHREGTVVEVLMLLARARTAQGDDLAGREHLREALRRAAPEGHVQVFVDEGEPLAELLRSLDGTADAADLVGRILAGLGADVPAPRAGGGRREGLVDELSQRELDVLRLLRSDLSGPEIARELLVSLNTLRTHTKSIYAKLGVNSRRTAVRRADELGL